VVDFRPISPYFALFRPVSPFQSFRKWLIFGLFRPISPYFALFFKKKPRAPTHRLDRCKLPVQNAGASGNEPVRIKPGQTKTK